MKLQVLGSDGGALLGHKTPGFLLNDCFLLDAGTICSALSLHAISEIDHIFISHSHIDHVKDLGFIADLMVGRKEKPIMVYGVKEVLKALKDHYFNDIIWPDFTRIPSAEEPTIKLCEIEPLKEVEIGELRFTPIPVNHTVPTFGFLVKWDGGSFLYSADTGPTEKFWEVANAQSDLRGIILDVSFPNRLQFLADISGHLSPNSAEKELLKLEDKSIPILFFHLKPGFYNELLEELRPMLTKQARVLRPGDRFDYSSDS